MAILKIPFNDLPTNTVSVETYRYYNGALYMTDDLLITDLDTLGVKLALTDADGIKDDLANLDPTNDNVMEAHVTYNAKTLFERYKDAGLTDAEWVMLMVGLQSITLGGDPFFTITWAEHGITMKANFPLADIIGASYNLTAPPP